MDDKILKSNYSGELELSGFKLSCAVLPDGTRVLVSRSLANAFGIKGSGAYWQKKKVKKGALLPEYLSARYLKPYIHEDLFLKLSHPIKYINKSGTETEGLSAELLADICDIYIKAGEKGALSDNQYIAENAYKILMSFSKVGIVALIDEATGYIKDKNRAKDELQKFLSQFMREEAAKWVKRFDDSFFECIYKMRGWNWNYTHKHPGILGIWINDIVYQRIAPMVYAELKKKNPINESGHRKHKHHSFLSDEIGVPRLLNHISAVEALARASNFNWNIFMNLVDNAFPKQYQQMNLIFDEDINDENKEDLSDFNKNLKKAIDYNPKE
jgi:hypothetical protein